MNSWSLEGNVLLVQLGGMPVMFEFELSSYAEKALQSGMRFFRGKPLFSDR